MPKELNNEINNLINSVGYLIIESNLMEIITIDNNEYINYYFIRDKCGSFIGYVMLSERNMNEWIYCILNSEIKKISKSFHTINEHFTLFSESDFLKYLKLKIFW